MLEILSNIREVLLISPLSIVNISMFFHRYLVSEFWNFGIKFVDRLLKPYSFLRIVLKKLGIDILKDFL